VVARPRSNQRGAPLRVYEAVVTALGPQATGERVDACCKKPEAVTQGSFALSSP